MTGQSKLAHNQMKQMKLTEFFKTFKEIELQKKEQEKKEKIISALELEKQIEEEMRYEDRQEREHGGSWWRM